MLIAELVNGQIIHTQVDDNNLCIINYNTNLEIPNCLILDYKATHGVVDETAKVALQKWYLNDKGISTQKEIMELISAF